MECLEHWGDHTNGPASELWCTSEGAMTAADFDPVSMVSQEAFDHGDKLWMYAISLQPTTKETVVHVALLRNRGRAHQSPSYRR